MHDNRWEGEKDEDKEKEDKSKREIPKMKRKEADVVKEKENEEKKVVDKAKPPKVEKSKAILQMFHSVKVLHEHLPPSGFTGKGQSQRRKG